MSDGKAWDSKNSTTANDIVIGILALESKRYIKECAARECEKDFDTPKERKVFDAAWAVGDMAHIYFWD